jgi:predicted RND superfamily exporter protein
MTVLMPIVFSYLPVPKPKHIKYLENIWMNNFLKTLDYLAQKRTKGVFVGITILTIGAGLGIYQLKTLGYILDDVPKTDKLYQDLKFYERNFNGIMPFDVVIDTKTANGLLNLEHLNIINNIQDSLLKAIPEFTTPLSIVNVAKFARQGFYNGDSSKYALPSSSEQVFLLPYLRKLKLKEGSMTNSLVDKDLQKARINFKMTDAGSKRLAEIEILVDKITKHFLKDVEITATKTGYSLIFLRGNTYLVESLFETLAIAIGLITVCIAFLFRSLRLVLITIIPNLIALLVI